MSLGVPLVPGFSVSKNFQKKHTRAKPDCAKIFWVFSQKKFLHLCVIYMNEVNINNTLLNL